MNFNEPPPSFSSKAAQPNLRSTANQMTGDSYNRVFVDGQSQPPSIGAVRPIGISEPFIHSDLYTDATLPPSLNDVGRREASQTGPSFTGNQTFESQDVAGMSLTGSSFRKFYPNSYHKDKDQQ